MVVRRRLLGTGGAARPSGSRGGASVGDLGGEMARNTDKAGVHYKTEDIDHFHHSKQVIIALGATSDRTLYDRVQTTDIPVVQIGDCRDVGYIHGAMADARDAILKL